MSDNREKVLKKERFEDLNGDFWNLFKLQGRFGSMWAIARVEDEDWDMPFFATRKDAIRDIELCAQG